MCCAVHHFKPQAIQHSDQTVHREPGLMKQCKETSDQSASTPTCGPLQQKPLWQAPMCVVLLLMCTGLQIALAHTLPDVRAHYALLQSSIVCHIMQHWALSERHSESEPSLLCSTPCVIKSSQKLPLPVTKQFFHKRIMQSGSPLTHPW